MNEIEDVYRDILAEYPNCGGFERDVGKFMAEVKRVCFKIVISIQNKSYNMTHT